jgi:hypothetical protein
MWAANCVLPRYTVPFVQAKEGLANWKDGDMKYVLSSLLVCLAMTVFAADANAAVCARGVYRAGCVGPRGAVVVHRPVGCAWVNGRRVCRY